MSRLIDRHFGSAPIAPVFHREPVAFSVERAEVSPRDPQEIESMDDPDLSTSSDVRLRLEELISSGVPCMLAVADVDDLGKWNNLLGREAGDDILNGLGMMLRHTSPDIMTRIAGDTHIVIYVGSEPLIDIEARILGQIRHDMESSWIGSASQGGPGHPPTVSVGVAAYFGGKWRSVDEMFMDALEQLDERKRRKPKWPGQD